MYKRGILSIVVGALLLLPSVASAGCWECSDDRCEQVAFGDDGFDTCYSWQHCLAGFLCADNCDTLGTSCTGSEFPDGPETQGLKIQNGEPLDVQLPLRHTALEVGRA